LAGLIVENVVILFNSLGGKFALTKEQEMIVGYGYFLF